MDDHSAFAGNVLRRFLWLVVGHRGLIIKIGHWAPREISRWGKVLWGRSVENWASVVHAHIWDVAIVIDRISFDIKRNLAYLLLLGLLQLGVCGIVSYRCIHLITAVDSPCRPGVYWLIDEAL
jgi:hypothetical protein